MATYHVLHNAIRNAVKHGAVNEEVTIRIGPHEDGTMIGVFNLPGSNHPRMCALQDEQCLQLMDCKADDINLESLNVGSTLSSYQGCRDIRNVVKFLGGMAQLNFLPDGTNFVLKLPGLKPVFQACSVPSCSVTGLLDKVCVVCADDQNPPRMQIPSALEKLGVSMLQPRQMSDVKEGIYRDEPKLKLFGRTAEEVAPQVWRSVLEEWKGQPTVVVLDQNICFTAKTVLGTNICVQLREAGFRGIIAIRSGNESHEDKKAYKAAGADAVLSKSLTTCALALELKKLMIAATVRPGMRSVPQ